MEAGKAETGTDGDDAAAVPAVAGPNALELDELGAPNEKLKEEGAEEAAADPVVLLPNEKLVEPKAKAEEVEPNAEPNEKFVAGAEDGTLVVPNEKFAAGAEEAALPVPNEKFTAGADDEALLAPNEMAPAEEEVDVDVEDEDEEEFGLGVSQEAHLKLERELTISHVGQLHPWLAIF